MAALIPFLLVTLASSALGQVPEGCIDPPGNNAVADIIVQALEAARPLLVTGIPALGIPPLDPFGPLPKIPFRVDTSGLWLEGMVNDTYVRNIAEFVTCSVNLTFGIAQKFDSEFRLQNFHMDGFYDVDGLALSLFPIFGNGGYRIDVYDSGFKGGAKINYNPLTDHASLKDLSLDIFFASLELEMECILGCGDMSDLINGAASEIAPVMFNAIWDYISPILSGALQDGINDILKNISISDIITPEERRQLELGNANDYLDLVMANLGPLMEAGGLDPAPLPAANLDFGMGVADLYNGQLTGLSTLHRDGTCTLDRVADWLFLYANVAVENLGVHYTGRVSRVAWSRWSWKWTRPSAVWPCTSWLAQTCTASKRTWISSSSQSSGKSTSESMASAHSTTSCLRSPKPSPTSFATTYPNSWRRRSSRRSKTL
nr:uncharacterized protein LOC113827911 [Penaeus vannamei]